MAQSGFPSLRLRRLRSSSSVRGMLAEPPPGPEKFIWPVFVIPGKSLSVPIDSMPGQSRHSVDSLCKAVEPIVRRGIGGVLVFGVPDESSKTLDGRRSACSSSGLVQKSVASLKSEFPELTVLTDVCLCAYTGHGHCGVLGQNGVVDNDKTLKMLAEMAVSHAAAGADAVAPSAMMDGQVSAIRSELDASGFTDTILMSYSTKFASSMYGPFRDAAGSKPGKGDRKSYQADFAAPGVALMESVADAAEGADILMVKPALLYLDIIARVKESCSLPLAAYNVSGEYSMMVASAMRGWGDMHDMAFESLCAIRRAGADIIISYWANQYDEIFKRSSKR